MDIDANSKKRKREDESESGNAGNVTGSAGATPGAPVKKTLDLAAMKAKMAETKRKMEEMKAASARPQEGKPSSSPLPSLPSAALPPTPIAVAPPTSSANARFLQEQQEKRAREQRRHEKEAVKPETPVVDPSFDPRLKRAAAGRKARPLVFLGSGELTKRAEEQNEMIMKLVEAKQESTEVAPAVQFRRARPVLSSSDPIAPEWWDQPYLQDPQSVRDDSGNAPTSMEVDGAVASADNLTFNVRELKEDLITAMIEHPVLTKPMAEEAEPAPRTAMLTPEQERKLAKAKRRMALEVRKEEVMLGIRPADKGKVKISNMMKVYSDSITDPTLVEKRVREELAQREARHHARNQERKLTPEQRKAKEAEKLKEDTSLSSSVAVFRVLSLANPKNRFKIDRLVQKNNLTGAAIYTTDFTVLAIEGGPKSVARVTKKLLHKVPWTQPLPPPRATPPPAEAAANSTSTQEGESAKEEAAKPLAPRVYGKSIDPELNQCHLVWKGEVVRRAFIGFTFILPREGPKEFLKKLGVPHYFDAAQTFTPPEEL